MGWRDEDGGDSRDCLDHAGEIYWDIDDSQFAGGNYWGSGYSYAVDDRDTFGDSGDDEGLLSNGDGCGEDYDDVYGKNEGSSICSKQDRYGVRGFEQ